MLLYINESLLYVFLCASFLSSDYQLIDTKYEQKANLTDQLNRLHFGLIYFFLNKMEPWWMEPFMVSNSKIYAAVFE